MRPVVKIGGSLLRSADDFIRAAKFLASYERPPIAVVSAVKGVTDMLLELYKTRSYLMFEEVAHRHISIARALGVEDEVAPLLRELEAALQLPKEPWAVTTSPHSARGFQPPYWQVSRGEWASRPSCT